MEWKRKEGKRRVGEGEKTARNPTGGKDGEEDEEENKESETTTEEATESEEKEKKGKKAERQNARRPEQTNKGRAKQMMPGWFQAVLVDSIERLDSEFHTLATEG